MSACRFAGLTRRSAPVIAILLCTACVQEVRVPLAVPVVPVGGARPGGPSGLHGTIHFGDGLWGQEQERAEMTGGGLGISVADRVELDLTGSLPTRSVDDPGGGTHPSEWSTTVRGKLRLFDFWSGRAALGVQAAYSWASRSRTDVQNEELGALDLAVPVEVYFGGRPGEPHRFGAYAAPRVVVQRFWDRLGPERSSGTTVGGLFGLAGRWQFLSVSGELDLVRTGAMEYQGGSYGGTWILLPVIGARMILPVGQEPG